MGRWFKTRSMRRWSSIQSRVFGLIPSQGCMV